MGSFKSLAEGVVVACLLGLGLADLSLFPPGRELTYMWHLSVSTGTVLPSELNSTFDFSSRLIVQQISDNTTLFKVVNITSRGWSADMSSLERPFKGVFSTGELTSLHVQPEDETWAINMKRALSSLLQLRLTSIISPSFSSFIASENGLFGKCSVEYVVINSEDSITLRKVLNQDGCTDYPAIKYSNLPFFKCPRKYMDLTATGSERLFQLTPFDEVLIKEVTAIGRILFQPYKAKSEAHYSKVSQTLTFESVKPLEKEIAGGDLKEVELIYEDVPLDPKLGRAPSNTSLIIEKIHSLLGELSDSLSSWEVGVKGLDNQTAFQVRDLMLWLDLDAWQTLYSSVNLGTSYRQETIQHLFWELVPKVGSRASVLFVRDLVKSNKVKGFLAGYLLVNLPFYLRDTSEELLTQCEELLHLGKGISPDVRNSAVLSFASLMHKTCKSNCKADTVDRYAKLYLDKFTESTSYDEKMLYLQGLSNMELGQALDFLGPIISGVSSSDRHVRFLSVWATLHTIHDQPDKVFEVFWGVLSRRTEALELRVSALSLLLMSSPTPARLFSVYWQMQSEPSAQLYNFYYTTLQSLAATRYPCYAYLAPVAGMLVRFVGAKSRHWATGNYILDLEDESLDSGGLLQLLLVAGQQRGLPNILIFMAEQHAMGYSREYALYLKAEGLDAALDKELTDISQSVNSTDKISEVLNLLGRLNVSQVLPERLHLEVIFKVDGQAVLSHFLNQTSFTNWTNVVHRLSSTYSEFSVNYQNMGFPQEVEIRRPNDAGLPSFLQMRATLLTSARGSINQHNDGRTRDAELDLRFSWNGITTLRVFNPFNNSWSGADRSRNLHIRLPFATQLIMHAAKSFFKVTAVRHRGFVAGSRLGLVWHASSRLVECEFCDPVPRTYPNISDEWAMDSEDLGVRLGASVFDCSQPDTLPETLHVLKGAFLADGKNYQMLPGGVALLGLLSLKDQLQFQPSGGNCGVMLYFSPLQTQVEPVLLVEGSHMSLSMKSRDGLVWELQSGSKRLSDGNEEFVFKLYRAPSASVGAGRAWRVMQLEGALIVPSRLAGVFHLPAAVTGYALVSWGASSPDPSASLVDVKLSPGAGTSRDLLCTHYTPACLQAASDLAARQTATINYANLPVWLKMAAHALFPEHIQTESSRTQVTFAYPVALVPWNTKGLCAINAYSVLTFDNATLNSPLSDCYTLASADCSQQATFAVLVKKHHSLLGIKIVCGTSRVEILPELGSLEVRINGTLLEESELLTQTPLSGPTHPALGVRLKDEGVVEVELGELGVVVQHYNTTVVVSVPASLRGYTCGVCGDFNGDTDNEPPGHPHNCLPP